MIQSLELKGFQSHLHTKVDFVDGVSILVGPSRNGKTAILRALNWLINNRPIGIDGFITHGQKEISVTITIDGHTITRKKNSKENIYILDGEKFAGIGSNVPAPIAELLNLSDLNISNQFDQPYLLFDSPGQVAQQLNSIVNLSSIDTTLANITSMKRQNDQDIRLQESRIAELQALEDSFPDLEAAEEFITELESQEKEKNKKYHKMTALQSLQDNLKGCRYNLVITQVPEGIEEKTYLLFDKLNHKNQLSYTKESLLVIQTKLAQAGLSVKRIAPDLRQEQMVIHFITKQRKLFNKKTKRDRLIYYSNAVKQAQGKLSTVLAIISQEELKFKEQMPDICPLCDRVME
jgi:DNA repair protein SbcC/Rad50